MSPDRRPDASRSSGAGLGTAERNTLTSVAERGVAWTGFEVTFRLVSRVGVLALLARFLAPADFGLFAAASIFLEVASPLSTMSVEHALVQRPALGRAHITAAWATTAFCGSVIGGVLYMASPIASRFFGMPSLATLLAAVAPLVLLQGLAQLPTAQLRRDMRFRSLSLVNLAAGNLASSLCSIALALLGYGVWSLVAGYAADILIRLVAGLVLAPPRFCFDARAVLTAASELLSYGIGQSGALLLNVVARQGDYVVVGMVLGATALGYYTRAYQLMSIAPGVLAEIGARVAFPVLARMQDDRPALRSACRATMSVSSVLGLPAAGFAIAFAPELVATLLGGGWEPVVLPLRVLSLGIFLRTAISLAGSISLASARVYALALRQGAYALLVVGGAWLTVGMGLASVAGSTLFALSVFLVLLLDLVHRASGLPRASLLRACAHGLPALGIVLFVGLAVRLLAAPLLPSAGATLAAGTAACAAVLGLTMAAVPRVVLGPELASWAAARGWLVRAAP